MLPQMLPQKFIRDGKKFVRFKIGEEVIEAELAPRELINEIISKYEVPPSTHQVNITLDKTEAQPNERIGLSGWFTESDEGKYRVFLYLQNVENNQWKWGHLIGEIVIKKREEQIVEVKEIHDAVKNAFGERAKHGGFYYADSKYYLANVNKLVNALREAKVVEKGYESEWFDCDDFSFLAMGVWHGDKELARMACFIVWVWWKIENKVYAHALNGAYDGQFKLIEPQAYKVFSVPSNWNLIVLIG